MFSLVNNLIVENPSRRFSMPDAALFLEHMIVDSPIHKGNDKLEFRPTNETPKHLRNLYEKMLHTKGCVVLNDFEVGYA